MNIVVTLNQNYIPPLCVMLRSLLDMHEHRTVTVYVVHSSLEPSDFEYVRDIVNKENWSLVSIVVSADFLADAPVLFHFSKEMYYRIFASELLPPQVTRALYLDPDMVILSPLDELYDMPFESNYFVAARSINALSEKLYQLRLKLRHSKGYFNSGVLLMNLELLAKEQDMGKAMAYIDENKKRLILPDQDVLNALYGERTILVDPIRYNFDARYYNFLHIASVGQISLKNMHKTTSIIHYCGQNKPWNEDYRGAIGVFYGEAARRTFVTSRVGVPALL